MDSDLKRAPRPMVNALPTEKILSWRNGANPPFPIFERYGREMFQ